MAELIEDPYFIWPVLLVGTQVVPTDGVQRSACQFDSGVRRLSGQYFSFVIFLLIVFEEGVGKFYWARSQNCEERLFASSCLSVRPPAWNNSAATARIFVKFDI
jgi:hypothetical protein